MGVMLMMGRGSAQVAEDRKISPQDLLSVLVVGEKDLTLDLPVSATGEISPPLLENVTVAGKTTSEVKKILEDLYRKDYLKRPQVVVTVKNYRRRTVTVMGMVSKPGLIELPPEQPMDIVQAIAQAGDLTEKANPNRIEVSREGRKLLVFKWDELKKITDPAKKFWLLPDDRITVHETFL